MKTVTAISLLSMAAVLLGACQKKASISGSGTDEAVADPAAEEETATDAADLGDKAPLTGAAPILLTKKLVFNTRTPKIEWKSGITNGTGTGTFRFTLSAFESATPSATVSGDLPDGKHKMLVQEKLKDGGWSKTLTVDFTIDLAPPLLFFGPPVPATDSVTFPILFGDGDPATFKADALTLTAAGPISGKLTISGSGANRVAKITEITGQGNVKVTVAPKALQDVAGNYSLAGASQAVGFDFVVPPKPVLDIVHSVYVGTLKLNVSQGAGAEPHFKEFRYTTTGTAPTSCADGTASTGAIEVTAATDLALNVVACDTFGHMSASQAGSFFYLATKNFNGAPKFFPGGGLLGVAEMQDGDRNELYRYANFGSNPVKLNNVTVPNYGSADYYVYDFAYQGDTVLYRATGTLDSVFDLYSVKLDGSNHTMAASATAHGGITKFAMTSDATQAVYVGEYENPNIAELYVSGLDGTGRVRLTPTTGTFATQEGKVEEFKLAASDTKVVYVADQDTDFIFDLYAVDIDGTNNIKLSAGLDSWANRVRQFEVTAGGRVVYIADQDTDYMGEVYSVPLTGGTPDKLSPGGSAVTAGDAYSEKFLVTSDGSKVILKGFYEYSDQREIYAVSSDGTGRVKLNSSTGPFATGDGSVEKFVLTDDETRIVYTADEEYDDALELYVVNLDGTERTKLSVSNARFASGEASVGQFFVKGDLVVYRANPTYDRSELFAVRLDGTGHKKLSHEGPALLDGTGGIRQLDGISSDGKIVAYSADMEEEDQIHFYLVPTDGGTPFRVTKKARSSVNDATFSPFGRFMTFSGPDPNDG